MADNYISRIAVLIFITAISTVFTSCTRQPEPFGLIAETEVLSGGENTVFDATKSAFGNRFPNLSGIDNMQHSTGDLHFGATFVTAPALLNEGLGPIYNNVACTSCHINDGRGKPIQPGERAASMLLRISVPGQDSHGGPLGVPGFGGQLQDKAIFGKQPEGTVTVQYITSVINFINGTNASLQQPEWIISNPYMPLPSNTMLSARMAPPVHGLGMLEAIPEVDIMAAEDIFDANGDGISGKANVVWNVAEKRNSIGRFGWKAEAPTILQQVAGAYNEDMGVTSYIFPNKSSNGQSQYVATNVVNTKTDITDSILHATTFYIKTLSVPARRNIDNADVVEGKIAFNQAGCQNCHTPKQTTATNVGFRQISNQTIYPYTDMLLHDMGQGLADNRPAYKATGTEWRTAPLWGIGLTKIVNGHSNFLHDGRARNLEEAILWHGGEAETAKTAYRNYSATKRAALLKFLESL